MLKMKIHSNQPTYTQPENKQFPKAGGIPLKKLLNITCESQTTDQPLSARTITSIPPTSIFYVPLKVIALRNKIHNAVTGDDFKAVHDQIGHLADIEEKNRLNELVEEQKKKLNIQTD